jgi:hypothetical protein
MSWWTSSKRDSSQDSTAYIAVNIQGLYTVYKGAGVRSTVALLRLAMKQERRQPPQGSPPQYWPQEKSE